MRRIGYNSNLHGGLVSSFEAKCKKEGNFAGIHEPISVLDTRSPSPSTSTSTLGNGGGGCSTDNNSGSLVVKPESTLNEKWPVSALPEPENDADGARKDEWAAELQPISSGGLGSSQRFGLGVGLEDWENLLSESACQDQSLLRWISGDFDDTPLSLKQLLQAGNVNEINETSALETSGNAIHSLINPCSTVFGCGISTNQNNNKGNCSSALAPNSCNLNNNCNPQNPNLPLSQQHQFATHMINNQSQQFQMAANLEMLCSNNSQQEQHQFEPQMKRHNSGITNCSTQIGKVAFLDPGYELLLSKQQSQIGMASQLNLLPPYQLQQRPFIVPKQEAAGDGREQIAAARNPYDQQQQFVYDQLYKAAELIMAGNFSHAQAILARLNHQLTPNAKPFQRAAFYFKESLQSSLLISNPVSSLPQRIPTPVDGMFKIGAYKMLSETSPIIQFMNFTSNQATLEAIGDANRIHILDFDIGFGAQWSSFLQELKPRRDRGAPSLKITAFASPTTHHPIELSLMHENLTQFASEIGVSFELEVVNVDSFDPSSYPIPTSRSLENEAIAVNFPIWSSLGHLTALPSILHFIKQLSPKIVVSMDHGCELTELPLPQHLIHALQYYEVLFDSIDAADLNLDSVNKIERFLFQPKIESMVSGRLHVPEQMPPWKSLFASIGFSPVAFSNFAETQAECVVKRTQVRGFHLEKCAASLVLYWQNHVLMSASAWRCW